MNSDDFVEPLEFRALKWIECKAAKYPPLSMPATKATPVFDSVGVCPAEGARWAHDLPMNRLEMERLRH